MMLIKKQIQDGALGLAVAMLTACGGSKPTAGTKKSDKSAAAANKQMELTHLYYSAAKEKILGNNDQAMKLFFQVLLQ